MLTFESLFTVSNLQSRVFVTGAAGFIGSDLTERLLHLGFDVTGFDNLSSGCKENLSDAMEQSQFHFVEGDLLDPKATAPTLGESELVYHLAADPEVRVGAQTSIALQTESVGHVQSS